MGNHVSETSETTVDFPTWLRCQGFQANTSASTANRVERLAVAYGDLRRHHGRDRLAQILAELTYGMEDERHGRSNPSRVGIKGDLRTGLASLKNAATLFRLYLEGSQTTRAACPGDPRMPRPKAPIANGMFSGSQILSSAYQTMGHNPVELIARSAIWAHPNVVARLSARDRHATWFPAMRRKKANELRGTVVQGVRLDDNTYANLAIKRAVFGKRGPKGWHACHVWPGTCYDPRYHTSIANLLLLPAEIAGLSDHNVEVASVLQYRAFELFGWKPDESATPKRPERYPDANIWRSIPEPTPAIERGVAKWTGGNPVGPT
ncbi:MAG: hypothetical protein ACR2F8_06275 [Caulobacteraceae bacterium]